MPFPSPDFTIIADDLTGACDAIAPFAACGHPVHVRLAPPTPPLPQQQLTAYATDTRSLAAPIAVQIVRRFAGPLAKTARPLIKKVDSTLLGHVAAETSVVMGELGDAAALIAPAFPQMGRCIVSGELYVAGEAVGRSIPALVREQAGASCHTLPLSTVRCGPETLSAAIEQQWDRAVRWFAVDAELDEDLAVIASVIHASPLKLLPVGSGGLTRVLSRHPPFEPTPSHRAAAAPDRSGPIVLFVGSRNQQTLHQLGRLASEYDTHCFDLCEDPVESFIAGLNNNAILAVRVAWGDAARMALETIIHSCAAADLRGVVVTGGDTASLICRLAGCTHLLIEGEVRPGAPFGKFVDGLLAETPLVTKAGGFGDENALIAACEHFEARLIAADDAAHGRSSSAPHQR